jgi:hypothetical protein
MLSHYASEVDPAVEITFATLAVTEEQIKSWSLPSHPAKKTDSRHSRYGIDDAVELESIRPSKLQDLVNASIASHIDEWSLHRLLAIESLERKTLLDLAEKSCKL